jgi:magnesium chelatase subunit I
MSDYSLLIGEESVPVGDYTIKMLNQYLNSIKDREKKNPYRPISKWFNDGKRIDLFHDDNEIEYRKKLDGVPGLKELVKTHHKKLNEKETYFMMEFALHGMAEYSLISKHAIATGHSFKDLLSSMLNFEDSSDKDEDFNI